ncbi:MAG: hypothetical protein IIA36_11685 [Proteobacteria bacterium]|nr:hypothetical protein [Pseudomonadota bacterium]
MPKLELHYIILFVAFVLPGAISMYVYGLKIPQGDRQLKDLIVEAISFSTINFVLLFWLIQLLFQPNFIQENPFYSWILVISCFVILPVLWPFLLIRALRLATKWGWALEQARTAWDEFFSKASKGCWIIVELNDGSHVGGRFGEHSYASAYPDSGHIYIEELWEVNEDGTFGEKLPGTPAPGILLRPTDYKLVKVFKENTDG